MNITDRYKKMCDHPLIQDRWVPKVGDRTDKGIITRINKCKSLKTNERWLSIGWMEYTKSELIWLPSQEQLQEMVDKEIEKYDCGLCFWKTDEFKEDGFGEYFLTIENDDGEIVFEASGDSINELWLAFVMHELHGLKWSEEKGWK